MHAENLNGKRRQPRVRLILIRAGTGCAFAAAVMFAGPCLAQSATPATPAMAATPAVTVPGEPFEISETARKAYADAMKDARGLLAQKKYDEAIAKLDKERALRAQL